MARFHLLPLTAILMSIGAADAACFAPGTALPDRREIATDAHLGQSGRELALALLTHDLVAARRLLDRDPRLAGEPVGLHHDMLSVAVASCDLAGVVLVLAHGAPPDGAHGRGIPLRLALRANGPDMAFRLLKAGASPHPRADRAGPITTAIELNALGAVRMLLDFRADPNVAERTGNRPLQTALDMEHFRIAELLLDRGADPWAIDGGGGNLGSALATSMLTAAPDEAAARARLVKRLARLGWPQPIPTPAQIRALALAGTWPPQHARATGAPAVSPEVLALLRRRQDRQ